jgi:hypothetical protein
LSKDPASAFIDDLVGKVKDGEGYAVYFIDYQNGTEGIIQSMERLADA